MSSPSGEETVFLVLVVHRQCDILLSNRFLQNWYVRYRNVTNMSPHTVMFPETSDINHGCSSQALNLANADYIITYGRYSKFLKFSVWRRMFDSWQKSTLPLPVFFRMKEISISSMQSITYDHNKKLCAPKYAPSKPAGCIALDSLDMCYKVTDMSLGRW